MFGQLTRWLSHTKKQRGKCGMRKYFFASALAVIMAIMYGAYVMSQYFAATRSMVAEVLYLRQQQAANQRDINQLNDWYFEMREKMKERR